MPKLAHRSSYGRFDYNDRLQNLAYFYEIVLYAKLALLTIIQIKSSE